MSQVSMVDGHDDDVMQGDLISRSALIAEINRIGGHWHSDWETAGVLEMAHRIPAVDAVEVVRCKDCMYLDVSHPVGKPTPWYFCNGRMRSVTRADGFCSYGERKDGE